MDSQLEKDLGKLGINPEQMYALACSDEGIPSAGRGKLPKCIWSRMDQLRASSAMLYQMEYESKADTYVYIDVSEHVRNIVDELLPLVHTHGATFNLDTAIIKALEEKDAQFPIATIQPIPERSSQYNANNESFWQVGNIE